MFEDLLPGQCFSVGEHGDAVFMRMSTGSDSLQIVGSHAGRVYEFPGHAVYIRRVVTVTDPNDWSADYEGADAFDDPNDTDLWDGMFDDEDDENGRLMASMW